MEHMNHHDVIYVNFLEAANESTSYAEFINTIKGTLQDDLREAYPAVRFRKNGTAIQDLGMIFEQTKTKFIFVFDEWDCIFHKKYIRNDDKENFVNYLAALTKDKGYISLSYMTGVLPIAKYSSGSTINNFKEYTMATQEKFSEYFGFTNQEVDLLYEKYSQNNSNPKVTRQDLTSWYDGYCTPGGVRIYNPRSVVEALSNNQIASYWTETGSYVEIADYILSDIEGIKGSILRMIAGEPIEVNVVERAATAMKLSSSDEILSAMVVYGFLTYENGSVKIPNRELLNEFRQAVRTAPHLKAMREIESASLTLLQATLDCDAQTVAKMIGYIRTTDSPHVVYQNEAELSAAVKIAYLAARGRYEICQEDQAGAGYVDFIFYPRNGKDDGIILELKVGKSPEEALQQIKDLNYPLRFQGKIGEPAKTTGRIILVGINCPKGTREHQCKIEVLDNQ